MPARPSQSTRSRTVKALSRERIAAKALRLIDRHGLERLSMRQLGKALGVEAMALYYHFPSKADLLDAVAECLLEECEVPGPESGSPLKRVECALRSYRMLAIRHPNAFVLVTTRRFATERTFAFFERLLSPYFDLGLQPAMVARLFRLAGYFAGGAGHAEIATRAKQPDATPPALDTFSDPVHFPHTSAVAPHMRLEDLDLIFEFGLEIVLEATAQAAKRAAGNALDEIPAPRLEPAPTSR